MCLGLKYDLEYQVLVCLLSSCEGQQNTSSDKSDKATRQVPLVPQQTFRQLLTSRDGVFKSHCCRQTPFQIPSLYFHLLKTLC